MSQHLEAIRQKFGEGSATLSEFRDNTRIHLAAPEQLYQVMELLKTRGFDYLVDLTCVDYLYYPGASDRYGVVYALTNTSTVERLYVKVALNDPEPEVASVYAIWNGADWMEREVFDMFGIKFPGHPDLRRILMPEEFVGNPLRKDYPLHGRGERHNFAPLIRSDS